jgi:transposase
VLNLSELVRIYCCTQPTDMRKSFDSLAALVREGLGYDPLSGHLFVFRSRRGDRVKLLWWDRDGLALYYRRLEQGTFRFPATNDPQARSIEISSQELSLVLWGIDPASVKRQKRYQRAN